MSASLDSPKPDGWGGRNDILRLAHAVDERTTYSNSAAKILRNAKEDAAMDDSIREYRSLLIAQHPDLRDALDIISDD